jgi:lysophospholipase L1-like esterase
MKTSALERAKILLFGDSITQQSFGASSCGWGTCVADRYQRRADVLNRGFSGYNTDWFLMLASTDAGRSDLFDHKNVMLVTIFFGANDASDPVLNGRQHVPLGRYESNIGDIISLTRSKLGEDVGIILISPPPVCQEGRLRFQKEAYGVDASGKLERSLELSGTYTQGAARVAKEMGVPFLDLWTRMQFTQAGEERDNWRDFLSDGLHFSALGNEFVGAAVLDVIDECFPHLSVKPAPNTGNINSFSTCLAMQRMGPWHDDIDHTEAKKAFESL